MFLISENESLPSSFWNHGILTFLHSIVSINAPESELDELKYFANNFERQKKWLTVFCLLKSSRALVGKSTAILKTDIEELPWPNRKGEMQLAWWERVLLEDIYKYISEFIRIGQNSILMSESVSDKSFDCYAKVLVKLLGSVYTNLRTGKHGCVNGLAYQAFYFGETSELDWPENWSEVLEDIVFKGSGSAMQTNRVVRFYERNTLIIIKPDRLRHWIGSTAIRDADETLVDLQEQGF